MADDRGIHSRASYPHSVRILGAVFLHVLTLTTLVLPLIMLFTGSFMKIFGFFQLTNPWTIANWLEVLLSDGFFATIRYTIGFSLIAAIVGTTLYLLASWLIIGLPPFLRKIAETAMWLPWAFPGLIVGAIFLKAFLDIPILSLFYGTMVPVVLAIIFKELPLCMHIMRNSLEQGNRNQLAAARIAGARTHQLLIKFVVPLNTPALLLVALLTFGAAVRTVDTIILLAPPDVSTLSLLAFTYASIAEFETATVVGAVSAILSLFVAIVTFRIAVRVGYLVD